MSGQACADRAGLCSALWLPLFDDLADPIVAARLAGEAEEAGPLRSGGRHLVAAGVRSGHRVAGPGAWRAPRRARDPV